MQSKSIYGFTLIELLVVIMTMTLLFSLGFANYREFQRRQYLESASRGVEADLRYAQVLALSGKKTSGCNILHGYMFRRTSATQYRLESVCNNNQDCNMNVNFCVKTVNLPAGVTLNALVCGGCGNRFYFKSLARGISNSSNVVLTLVFSGSTKTTTVTPSGEIR